MSVKNSVQGGIYVETALFTIESYREGTFYCKEYYLVVNKIQSDGSEIAVIPKFYENAKVTHIGYYEICERLPDDWSDYQHMKSNNDVEIYHLYEQRVYVSPQIKKIVIHADITHISSIAFSDRPDLIFEVDEANPVYTTENGKLIRKIK